MGTSFSINKINFRDVQYAIQNNLIIINTLHDNNQNCLIKNTLSCNAEIDIINKYLKENKKVKIIIYGENCTDNNIVKKYNQLYNLGFTNIFVYIGGLFEWLLLQDIFGEDKFPTTSNVTNLLIYQGDSILN